jgi:hypothetical protein
MGAEMTRRNCDITMAFNHEVPKQAALAYQAGLAI